jgi:flagellar biosynthesis/type III secretory pathway M-ring protein FliF/YscJ
VLAPVRNLTIVDYVIAAFALAVLVALVVAAPLRRPAEVAGADEERRATLEAAKEAKYREIRDAEFDFRMGKIDESDYRRTDRELRDQAIAILKQIDGLEPEDAAAGR